MPELERRRNALMVVLALAASAWLVFTFVCRSILGPLSPDEIYFSHTLWLTLKGKRQYLDFYSHHLPVYFWLYDAILPRPQAADLSFIWSVRLSNVGVALGYVALLFWADRRRAIFLMPLLLAMIVISRMVEVRSDTPGLLLFNAGWVLLLRAYSRPQLLLAALLALAGALFSGRGLVMGVGFAAALIYAVVTKRDGRGLLMLALLGAVAAAAGIIFYVAQPHYVGLIIDQTLLDPATILVHLSFSQRIFAADRLPQVLLTIAALSIGTTCIARRQETYRAGIVAIACLAQLLLILFDPSPFPYVYAWSALPVVLGLTLIDRMSPLALAAGATLAAGLAAMTIAYPLRTGHPAPTGSNYRVLLDAPIDIAALRRLPDKDLVAFMLSGQGQHSLANQLSVRAELCRRIQGPVLSVWQTHPICLADASYYWNEIKWPNIWASGPPPASAPWFEAVFRNNPPSLVIWRVRPDDRTPLNAWARALLSDYDVGEGFALRRGVGRTGQVIAVGKPAG